jgi:hypothetical protein
MLCHGNEYRSLEMTLDSWVRIVFSPFNEGMAEVTAFFYAVRYVNVWKPTRLWKDSACYLLS